jgi:hypothetical protein
LPRLPMELPKPLIFLAAAHERIARLTSKTRERDNAPLTNRRSVRV